MRAKRFLLGLSLGGALAAVAALLFFVRYDPVPALSLSVRPSLGGGVPVGEIREGFRIVQSVDARVRKERLVAYEPESVCMRLLMANYGNRRNTGLFGIELLVDGVVHSEQVDASVVRDNADHRVCFSALTALQFLAADEVEVVVHGVSSPSGSAVTAWTTSDLSAGRLLEATGQLENRSLIFSFEVNAASRKGRVDALVFIIISALAVASVFLAVTRKTAKTENL